MATEKLVQTKAKGHGTVEAVIDSELKSGEKIPALC